MVPRFLAQITLVLTAVGLVGGLVVGLRHWLRQGLPHDGAPMRRALLMQCFILPPTMFVILLIHPRNHYLLTPLLLASALAVTGWNSRRAAHGWTARLNGGMPLAAFGLALIVGTSNLAYRLDCWSLVTQAPLKRDPWLPNRTTIAKLKELDLPAPIQCLCCGYCPMFYAGKEYAAQWPHALRAGQGFRSFLEEHDVQLVEINSFLRNLPWLKTDPEFQAFLADEPTDAFVRFPLPPYDITLAVRRDRLSARSLQAHVRR